MKIGNGRDFWAGLMFMAFGLAFSVIGYNNYNMGTAVRMGPAYFPVLLGGFLAILGLWVFISSLVSKANIGLRVLSFRPLPLVIGALCGVAAYYLHGGNEFLYDLAVAACLILVQAAFGTQALYVVLASVVVFAFLLKPLGLLLATALLVIVSRVASDDFKASALPKSVGFGVVMYAIFGVLMALLHGPLGAGWAGLVGLLVVIGLSVLGSRKMTGVEVGALFAILGVFAVVIFGHALGLPFNACPDALDDACRKIGLGS
jgi:hypothetical protein